MSAGDWSDIGCLITPPPTARTRRRGWSGSDAPHYSLQLVAQPPDMNLDCVTLDHGTPLTRSKI